MPKPRRAKAKSDFRKVIQAIDKRIAENEKLIKAERKKKTSGSD